MNEKYWEKIAAFIADLINTHEKLKKYQEFNASEIEKLTALMISKN